MRNFPHSMSYPDFPYGSDRDKALRYLRTEGESTDGWERFDEKSNVIYEKKYIEGDSSAIPLVRGRGVVHGYNPRQFLALISFPELRTMWDPRTQEARLLKRYSQHEIGFYTVQKGLGWLISPRDIVGIQDTIFHSDGKIERVQTSVPDELVPPIPGRVRATLTLAGWVLKPHDDGTEVTYIVKINPNGSIPIRVINGTVIPEIPAAITRCEELLAKDGYPPYILQSLQSILRTETFSSKLYAVTLVGRSGDTFDIVYDTKMYSGKPQVVVDGLGKDGVEVSQPMNGMTHVVVGQGSDGKEVILFLK